MNMKFQIKVFITLLMTVPMALLLLVGDALTADTALADEVEVSSVISTSAVEVGYGFTRIKVCVGQTKQRKAAGRGEVADDLAVFFPTIASAAFSQPPGESITKVNFTGIEAGTTAVNWTVNEIPVISRFVVVRDC